jgi:hypothetical protein
VHWGGVVRAIVLVLGALALVGGLLLIVGGDPAAALGGAWLMVTGAILLFAIAFERMRYRSEHAERTAAPPGPGGGEMTDVPMEPRFQPTGEVFRDPTTRRVMRVWLDPARGERRYRAED